jgi:Fe-S-cluster containining protein
MKFKSYQIHAISIERDDPESDVPCGDCIQCCVGLTPYLTPEEFQSGKYIYTFLSSPDGMPCIAIPRTESGCVYLVDRKCSIYESRPKACRQFDCRKGHYPKYKDIALEKFGEYEEY